MLLPVAKSVVAYCVESGYSSVSDDAAVLHIAMIHPESIRRTGTAEFAMVRATPDQFDHLSRWLGTQIHVEPGDSAERKTQAATLMRQARRIQRELRRLAAHPGYRSVAVAGTDLTVLPAFRCGEGRWWPTASQAVSNSDGSTSKIERTDLQPHQERRNTRLFTLWSADGDAPVAGSPEPEVR